MTKNLNILMLAGDTDGNLGDLAIVMATCEHLRLISPGANISLVTSKPERDCAQLGIVPIPRGLSGALKLIKATREADLVICGGGGLFQDDHSLVKMPYWALRLAILNLFNSRIAGLSIGAGPLNHGISRAFARVALKSLESISVRDQTAKSLLQTLTDKEVFVVPDPAFMLPSDKPDAAKRILEAAGIPLDGTPLIGVAPRQWFHAGPHLIPHMYASKLGLRRNQGKREMSIFIDRCADDLNRAIDGANAHVVFMPTYNVEHEDDMAVCNTIANRLRSGSHSKLMIDNPKTYKAITAFMSVMLCVRLHPAIMAAGNGVPVVALSYNPKFSGTFSLFPHPVPWTSIDDYVCGEPNSRISDQLLSAIGTRIMNDQHTRLLSAQTQQYLGTLLTELALTTKNDIPPTLSDG